MLSLSCAEPSLGQPKKLCFGSRLGTQDLSFKFYELQTKICSLFHRFTPLSLPFVDTQERILQLWQYKKKVFASVADQSLQIKVLSSARIHNSLSPGDTSEKICRKIEQVGLRIWHLAYIEGSQQLYIWPWIVAAGIDEELSRMEQTFWNIRKGHHTDLDLGAAKRESRGEIVKLKQTGIPFNHVKEVRQSQRGLVNIIIKTKEFLNNQSLSQGQRERAEKLLSQASKWLDKTAGYLPRQMIPANVSSKGEMTAKSFKESVQQNRLAESYNASHPDKQIVQRGSAGGTIGGVGNEVGIIEGLFTSLKDLEEARHIFCIPSLDGKPPFSNAELKQITRELAVGIYVYDTIPFFSLHFNQDSNLYPVMHPAYQNTLVGRVISLLDYHMKGFLNGVLFEEAFLEKWQGSKTHDAQTLLSNALDLREYCRKVFPQGKPYFSLKELIQRIEIAEDEQAFFAALHDEKRPDVKEPALFSEYSGFRSSFRIIAKQKSFKKSGSSFELDGGFDVFYTIEPDVAYQVELEKYRCQHGRDPAGYKRLVKAYDAMKMQIENNMPRLPMFRDLFEQLKVINFLSYYLKTLKKAQKIPVLGSILSEKDVPAPLVQGPPPAKKEKMELLNPDLSRITRTFSLFPYLPIRKLQHARVNVELNLKSLSKELYNETCSFLRASGPDQDPPKPLIEKILSHFEVFLKKAMAGLEFGVYNYPSSILMPQIQN